MNNTELDQEFRTMAADPPDLGSVRAAVSAGAAVRVRRRRTAALVSSALAVALIIGGVGAASRLGASDPTPATPIWPTERPVIIPDGSTLVPYNGALTVTSPVTPTVDAPADSDQIMWNKDVSTLAVAWTNPQAPGVSTATVPSGATATPDQLVQRGYVISTSADFPFLGSPPDNTTTYVPASNPQVLSIAGHPATIGDDPASGWAAMFGVKRWLTWQLSDGRYIHAWAGAGGDRELLAFGAGLVERPTTLARKFLVEATLPGYTVESATELGSTGTLAGGQIQLCPTGTRTVSETATTPPCLSVLVLSTALANRSTDGSKTVPLTVDGVTTLVNKSNFESTADLGRGFSLVLISGLPKEPADLDIATLAGSVRLDPTVTVGHSPYLEPMTETSSGSSSAAPTTG